MKVVMCLNNNLYDINESIQIIDLKILNFKSSFGKKRKRKEKGDPNKELSLIPKNPNTTKSNF